MYSKLYGLILIKICMLTAKSKSEIITNCPYEYTIDLTTSELLKNNSYLFNNDILVTPDLVHDYDFKIFDNGTRINYVEPHKRGCICAIKNCMRFCSNQVVEFYKNNSSPDIDKGFTKNVLLANKMSIEKHLIHDFYPIFGSLCEYENSKMLAPEVFSDNKWTLYEDGILLRHNDNRNLTQNEYCFDINVNEDNTLQFINPIVCAKKSRPLPWIVTYGLVSSIPFFIVIILFYSFLSNLRNVRGSCFITYLSLMTITYILISFYRISGIQLTSGPCQIYGYVIYYTTTAFLTWSCILCYDAWKSLTHMVPEQSSFGKYSIIGFSVPLILTLLTFIVNNNFTKFPERWSCIVITVDLKFALIYYDLPGLIVVIYSSTSYIMILRYSWKTKREQTAYFREIQEPKLERLMIYFRILILMGFEWIFITFSHLVRLLYIKNTGVLYFTLYVSGLITTFQGLFIFLIFICNSRVLIGIKKRSSKISSSIRIKLSRKSSATEEYRYCAPH